MSRHTDWAVLGSRFLSRAALTALMASLSSASAASRSRPSPARVTVPVAASLASGILMRGRRTAGAVRALRWRRLSRLEVVPR